MGQKVKWLDENCVVCGNRINTWDKRLDNALKYRNPTCEACIAKEYDRDVESLRDYFETYFGMRPCMGI